VHSLLVSLRLNPLVSQPGSLRGSRAANRLVNQRLGRQAPVPLHSRRHSRVANPRLFPRYFQVHGLQANPVHSLRWTQQDNRRHVPRKALRISPRVNPRVNL